jgi:hypothetical protein
MYTAQAGSAGSSAGVTIPEARDCGGKLRIIAVPYTVDGAEASADTINICKLKVGAKVIPSLCRVISGTGFDVDDMNVGISGNDNKYADDIDTLDTASDINFGVAGDNAYAPTAVAEGGETVIATLVNVVTTTAAGTVLFLIAYLDE